MSCFSVPGDMALNAAESDAVFVEGVEAVRQQIKTGFQVFAGAWHFDRNVGIDYIEDVFVKSPDLRVVRLTIWEFLLGVTGVAAITSLNLRVDSQTRTLYVDFEAETDFGTLTDTLAIVFPD